MVGKNEDIRPLTPDRWDSIEELFGPRGACGGCWCMWWRLSRSALNAGKGDANRDAFRRIVESGEVPGLLFYDDDQPVGWCSVAPREQFPVLGRSRALPPIDNASPWSVVCLFVRRDHRHQSVSVKLLDAAADYAAEQGAEVVEGYPVKPRKEVMPDAFAWTGTVAAFRSAGFTEAAHGPTGRVIMRRSLPGSQA